MRLVGRILHWYKQYRMVMWLSTTLGGVGVPLLGYGVYAWDFIRERKGLLTDNPELANGDSLPNVVDWLLGSTGAIVPRILEVLAFVGIFGILLLIVCQIGSFVARRTELSGVDHEREDQERADRESDEEDSFDDYGTDDNEDAFPSGSPL